MPVITPFGEVTLNDPVSISRWAAAHAAKHQQLVIEHIGPGGGILDEPIDGDWMLRHTSRHVALATAAQKMPGTQPPPLSSANTKVLALPGIWQTEAELQDWHDLHNRLHKLIDAQRAIAGVQAKPNQPHLPGRPPNIIAPAPPHGPIP
jgi:hypothetical protein